MTNTQSKESAENEINRRPVINKVDVLDDANILINGHQYQLVSNERDAFDREQLAERFSPVLSKYDYIVADIGYEQLRLKGFYSDGDRNAKDNEKQSAIQDYLLEFCNFGCAYFILKNLSVNKPAKKRSLRTKEKETVNKPVSKNKNKNKHPNKRVRKFKQKPFVEEKITKQKAKPVNHRQNKITEVHKRGKRSFTIRETK
ncbi:Hypothetical DUF1027 domain protein [Pediococcus damnosus]|uniref:Hypothetical DUF1027 domain protein n=1 Tax=Pediococcus damnosus TaxID=51663 RepID=A0A0R2HD44_9LACO|nr:YutD family protein [Pediococcus damnosus]AMV59882.1 Hypothetical DUF1027 domain protein [Pediococcus damnosus]AMV61825.1 Hypothetical DUF1027 domain protein [Pediococcus damnosus]AMV64128.1 Hypothetical DUF1027 domain protein [Pediococcus damnosus]AMV66301.1 Hypothetical DUF1027 domain protein [Pediococcus damnosus]AMV69995.1 Hypothetical DUF1027 domain protein [Pediococcus damnosus]